jgi:hypothetical protein
MKACQNEGKVKMPTKRAPSARQLIWNTAERTIRLSIRTWAEQLRAVVRREPAHTGKETYRP